MYPSDTPMIPACFSASPRCRCVHSASLHLRLGPALAVSLKYLPPVHSRHLQFILMLLKQINSMCDRSLHPRRFIVVPVHKLKQGYTQGHLFRIYRGADRYCPLLKTRYAKKNSVRFAATFRSLKCRTGGGEVAPTDSNAFTPTSYGPRSWLLLLWYIDIFASTNIPQMVKTAFF